MMTFEPGDIVHVPFPHVERAIMVRRPALVVAVHDVGLLGILLWTLMITNAARADWPGDLTLPHTDALGLAIPSKIRIAKISTVEASSAVKLGRIDNATWSRVTGGIRASFNPT